MCLGIPMQIVEINGVLARCQQGGIERDVNLFMLRDKDITPGDFVMVHVGYAIQKIDPQEAQTAWDLYDKLKTGEQDA